MMADDEEREGGWGGAVDKIGVYICCSEFRSK